MSDLEETSPVPTAVLDGTIVLDESAADPSAEVTLTARQAEVLLFICRFFAFNQKLPSGRRMLKGIGVRGSNPKIYVLPLIAAGYLVRSKPREHGSFMLTRKAFAWFAAQPQVQAEIDLAP